MGIVRKDNITILINVLNACKIVSAARMVLIVMHVRLAIMLKSQMKVIESANLIALMGSLNYLIKMNVHRSVKSLTIKKIFYYYRANLGKIPALNTNAYKN